MPCQAPSGVFVVALHPALAAIIADDWRSRIPRKSWSIGQQPAKTSITLHWNGPAVLPSRQTGDGLLVQIRDVDASWQMRPGWSNTPDGADGLQYHYVVDPLTGAIYLTRNPDAMLWHCAHPEGNARSVAVHVPIGKGQAITNAGWAGCARLFEALIAAYDLASRDITYGHREWSSTDCPGPSLWGRLLGWRARTDVPNPYQPGAYTVAKAYPWVRTAPAIGSDNRALKPNGTHYLFPVGGAFPVKAIVIGDAVGGNPFWAHHESEIGFVHMSQLTPAKE